MARTCKEVSRIDFALSGELPTHQEIQTGAIQRVADAAEKMAQNYDALVSERDRYRQWWKEEVARRGQRERSITALRGVITKLKKGRRR